MTLGRYLFLEFFLDTICVCDTVNAEVHVCGQGNVLPGHCVSEEIGMVLSKHSLRLPFLAPVP